ncbi:MAG: protein-glutamine glutaminase family protein [Oligoflexia bacterium]|nr:protein-glutamine glutaminase family protein [Oligoflexia bacterium]
MIIRLVIFFAAAYAVEFPCEQEWSKMDSIFQKSYACDYVDGNCYQNAHTLASKLLTEPGIDKTQLYVAYVYPRPGNASSVYARGGRNGSQEWKYHVLVVYKGQVMDHDHGKSATIKKVSDYIEDMFEKDIPEEKMIEGQHLFEPRSDALIRLIPATDYVDQTLRTHSGVIDYQRYINDREGRYPAMNIKQFLERFSDI